MAKCKGTTANTGTIRHQYQDAVAIPSTSLQLLPLGVVMLPTRAVRGAVPNNLIVYLAGDGTNYGYVNAFFLIPASFGGLIGWRSTGHAHELRWEDGMVYADDAAALSGSLNGGRPIIGKGGALVAVAEQATPGADHGLST